MGKNKIVEFKKPGEISEDPLTQLLRSGDRKLILDSIEVELQQLFGQYSSLKNEKGHQQIVRNGYPAGAQALGGGRFLYKND